MAVGSAATKRLESVGMKEKHEMKRRQPLDRTIIRLLWMLAFASIPQAALAVRPDADCRRWYAAGAWSTPAYALATATLTRNDGGVFVDVEESVDDTFLRGGGELLFGSEWTAPLPAGTYRVRIEAALYAHATGPLTTDEIATWNPAHRFTVVREGPT